MWPTLETPHIYGESFFTIIYRAPFFTLTVPEGSNLSGDSQLGWEIKGDMGVDKQDYNRTDSGTAFILQVRLTTQMNTLTSEPSQR